MASTYPYAGARRGIGQGKRESECGIGVDAGIYRENGLRDHAALAGHIWFARRGGGEETNEAWIDRVTPVGNIRELGRIGIKGRDDVGVRVHQGEVVVAGAGELETRVQRG